MGSLEKREEKYAQQQEQLLGALSQKGKKAYIDLYEAATTATDELVPSSKRERARGRGLRAARRLYPLDRDFIQTVYQDGLPGPNFEVDVFIRSALKKRRATIKFNS